MDFREVLLLMRKGWTEWHILWWSERQDKRSERLLCLFLCFCLLNREKAHNLISKSPNTNTTIWPMTCSSQPCVCARARVPIIDKMDSLIFLENQFRIIHHDTNSIRMSYCTIWGNDQDRKWLLPDLGKGTLGYFHSCTCFHHQTVEREREREFILAPKLDFRREILAHGTGKAINHKHKTNIKHT